MIWVCSDILVTKFNTLVSISCLKAINWSCKVSKVQLLVAWVKDISCNRDFWYDASINSCSCSMVEQSGDSIPQLCSVLLLSTLVLFITDIIWLSCNDLSLVEKPQSINVLSLIGEISLSVQILVRRVF